VPLVVLVNERSASASEIVSGAVRDNGRGLVIGERTFGKFSVQNLIPLGRGGAKLKITTARYHLPKGASLHREPTSTTWGVEPDIPIPLVFKEKENIWKGWRDANLLGPAKAAADAAKSKDKTAAESDDEDAPLNPASESEKPEDAEGKEKASDHKDAGKDDEGDEKAEEAKLPPLEQPDENNRPKGDPQLDVAVLVLRMLLVGEASPTLATAELKSPDTTAQP
jgi:carboxyl-terminal processing protease